MKKKLFLFAFVVLNTLTFSQKAFAKDLTVCTKEAPPFSFKNKSGQWEGLTIDLLKEISQKLNHSFNYKEVTLKEMVEGLTNGACDLSASALSITAQREEVIDFSAPFYSAGLGIAVQKKPDSGISFVKVIRQLISWEMIVIVFYLLVVLFVAGFFLWLFERKKNPDEFGGTALKGLGASLWWSAVTMTTVGYGDKAPRTFGGRIVGLIWMFTAIIIISSFTAAIASIMTVSSIGPDIRGVDDLYRVNVGAIPDSISESTLASKNISFRSYENTEEGLKALEKENIQAFVDDAPLLKFSIKNSEWSNELMTLTNGFTDQHYAIGFPQQSPLRETFSREILRITKSSKWVESVNEYLNESD